ncbi:MAG: PEGA domain-containing protein [Calditrichia bacterium]
MALTPDEEKKLREQIRDGLQQREERIRESLDDRTSSRQEQMEMRMRQMIREEEEAKYFSERGFVKHKNRYGELEWLPKEESERRQERRRTSKSKGNKKSKQNKQGASYLTWAINLAIFGAAAIFFLYLLSYNPLRSSSKVGALSIETDVPGARVFLNGVEHKKQTPAQIEGLSVKGTYYISVYRDGYSSWPPMQKVTPSNGETTPVQFQMKHSSLLGRLNVQVNQEDYSLFINGVPFTAKKSAIDIPAGYHIISVIKDGYLSNPSFQRVLIAPDSASSLQFHLQAVGDLGYLDVSSNRSVGFIYMDNSLTGRRANSGAFPVRPGLHEVRLRANGMQSSPEFERIRIEPGKTIKLNFSLKPAAFSDTLDVLKAPFGASIVLNGEVTPYVTPAMNVLLSPGQHFVNLMVDNRLLSAKDVLLDAGKPDINRFQLEF